MLNSYASGGSANVNNSIKINAVSGNILKNYQKSFFKRFFLNSQLATEVFDENDPHIMERNYPYTKRPIVIIQMMVCGESEVIAEIMWKSDFDELFS